MLVRQNYTKDLADSAALHKKDHEAKLKEAARLAAVRMGKADAAMEVELIETVPQLVLELGAVSATCAKIGILSGQFDGRRNGFEKREYKVAQVGNKFRDKHGKIRKWPKKGESKLEYIQELV